MDAQAQQSLSLDEMAAQMAGEMLSPSGQLIKGAGGAGDMPQGRGGAAGAEGGFTPQAGGQVIDAKTAKAMEEGDLDKAQGPQTGADVTSEPGRQGPAAQTGSKVSNQPARALGGGAGEPANIAQDEDDSTRARKKGKVGISKADGEDEEEEDDAEKSGNFDADDLIKSLEVLEAVAQGSSVPAPADRRAELGEKLAEGTLSKGEMAELSDLMKAGAAHAEEDEPFEKSGDAELEYEAADASFQEQFADDPDLNEGYEVSSFLERHSQMTASALDQVQGTLAKSLDSHRDRATAFNSQLAKSLMGMAQLAQRQETLIKSLTGRLDTVENQPLPRRGVTTQAQILNKSMGAEEVGGAGGQLSKSEVADVLEQMAMRGVQQTASGHRVDYAMAMLEQGGQIAKSLYNDVVSFKNGNNGQVNVQ